ncbi:MAG: hypothetical protein RLZZ297_97 [Chloroflexota bacterium]|jgi:uridine phosphorylase
MTHYSPDDVPLLEFDPNPRAFINADEHYHPLEIPSTLVFCFFHEVITTLVQSGAARQVHALRSEIGQHPLYILRMADGSEVCLMHPGLGAPMAAALLEELIGHGIRTVVAVGGAGSLQNELTVGHVVVPSKALRDEGTSYHYVAPSRWIDAQPRANETITAVLVAHGVPYVTGPTWTTDAFYRETHQRIAQRRSDGCLTVEMETAALLAVAQLRGITLGQILYSGDDLSGTAWDSRNWHAHGSLREHLTYLAAEAVHRLG